MTEPVQRLFFALWPDAPVREALAALQGRIGGECGGRAVPPENLHVTLKFLGPVPRSALDDVGRVADAAPLRPVGLVLDRVGFWPRPAVVFVGADHVPAPLAGLVRHLEDALDGLGFDRERRRFSAHCTLFRKARRRPAVPIDPMTWPIDGFVLVESHTSPAGARYRVIEKWTAQ